MVIAQLRWQSQRRGIEIYFVFRDIVGQLRRSFCIESKFLLHFGSSG